MKTPIETYLAVREEIVRCCSCGRIWTGHDGDKCPFCTAERNAIAWWKVGITLAVVVMIASLVAL